HLLRAGVAIARLFLEELRDEILERLRGIGTHRTERRRLLERELRREDHEVGAAEGLRSAEHAEDHAAEREQIRAPVDLAPARLLRRHIPRRAEGLPRAGEALDVRGLRDPEVEELHDAF